MVNRRAISSLSLHHHPVKSRPHNRTSLSLLPFKTQSSKYPKRTLAKARETVSSTLKARTRLASVFVPHMPEEGREWLKYNKHVLWVGRGALRTLKSSTSPSLASATIWEVLSHKGILNAVGDKYWLHTVHTHWLRVCNMLCGRNVEYGSKDNPCSPAAYILIENNEEDKTALVDWL